MTGAPVDDDDLAPELAARSTIPSRSRPDLSAIFAGVRDLPEAIIAIVALLSMRALGVTPWIAIGLAVAIYNRHDTFTPPPPNFLAALRARSTGGFSRRDSYQL